MQDSDSRSGIQAIARAGRVLRALERAPGGIGLADLSAAVELPKSTVHRLVGALATEQLVATGPGGLITLGPGITRLAASRRDTLVEDLRPVLESLRDELDETVDLAVLDGSAARFVDQLAVPHRLRAVSAVGDRFPLHCTANGKALLAALPADDALALLPVRLPRFTEATITSRAALAEELDAIRSAGVAFDREEHTEGISAAGVVVLDAAGAPLAAISVPVPTARFSAREQAVAAALRKAVR